MLDASESTLNRVRKSFRTQADHVNWIGVELNDASSMVGVRTSSRSDKTSGPPQCAGRRPSVIYQLESLRRRRRSRGCGRGGNSGDSNTPLIRTFLEIIPTELAALHEAELVSQRKRIVIVDQLERLAGLQRLKRLENQRMPLRAGNGANVDCALDIQGATPLFRGWAEPDSQRCQRASPRRIHRGQALSDGICNRRIASVLCSRTNRRKIRWMARWAEF